MSNPTRQVTGILAALALALTWVWWTAVPASAGGPTSVIMVNPGAGRAAALHTTNPRYTQLVKAVGAYDPPTGSTTRPAGVSDCFECEIRLTWLIHDMRIWRIDRIQLTADDGIWIETLADESGERDLFDLPGQWQRPHDPATLVALLRATGVTSPAAADAANRQLVSVSAQPAAAGDADLAKVAGGVPGLPVGLVAAGSAVVGMAAGLGLSWLIRRPRHDRFQLTG